MTTARDYARGVNPNHEAAYHKERKVHTGLQPYSGKHLWTDYIIFEVGHSKVQQQAFKSWALDRQIGFKELVGSYQGQQAAAFITKAGNLPAIEPWIDQEESILFLGAAYAPATNKSRNLRPAKLIFKDGSEVELGDWQQVTRGEALDAPGWTFDPTSGNYYLAREA